MRGADLARLVVLAAIWGALFLGEAITATMLGGAALVLAGTWLILGGAQQFRPRGTARLDSAVRAD